MEKPQRIARALDASVVETTQAKADLRREMLARRRALGKNTRDVRDAALRAALLAWCSRHGPSVLGIYYPINDEPDLHAAYEELDRRGVRLALPVVVGKSMPLAFAAWRPGTPLGKGPMGVPTPGADADRVHPDTLVAPCIAFNRECFRIGYGGGYYDRTLSVVKRPVAVGVAYQDMCCDFIPDDYDAPLDAVLTDNGVLMRTAGSPGGHTD